MGHGVNLQGGPSVTSGSMGADTAISDLKFLAHGELREGQHQMILDGNQVVGEGGFLLANAPTGIGKTAAALSTALSVARARESHTTILFMTGRQSQHRIIVDTVRLINERLGPTEEKVSLIDMIGLRGMCINELALEQGSGFNRACGELRSKRRCKPFLAESPGLRLRVLEDPLHVSELVAMARNHTEGKLPQPTCPWKVARETAGRADILVCDYNHLFIEDVRKASLGAMGLEMENLIIVVDEAHNLPERIRMGLRRTLTLKLIRDARMELEEYREDLERQPNDSAVTAASISRSRECEAVLKRFRNRLATWIKERRDAARNPGDIGAEVEVRVEADQILGMLRAELSGAVTGEQTDLDGLITLLSLAQADLAEDDDELASDRLATVLAILRRYATSPAMCVVLNSKGDESRLTTHLLDPAIIGEDVFKTVAGGVLMSGTLTPPTMYADTLGIPKGRAVTAAEYPSPFMADRRPVMIAKGVTSLFKRRSEDNTARIRQHLHALLQHTPGHVAVFCPSYAMLENIIEEANWPGRMVWVEATGWSKNRVDGLLEDLRQKREQGTRVLLAGVFGGRLSEGVDYAGNILDAVVCIGIPNAPKSVHNDALRGYIEDKHGKGKAWRYAVMQPAVNRILQGMGRAIRKAEDRAFILLLDDRLLSHNYRQCLPPTLSPFTAEDSKRTANMVRRFFARHPDPARGQG
jgi:DNA excision repair protein ERCC-2